MNRVVRAVGSDLLRSRGDSSPTSRFLGVRLCARGRPAASMHGMTTPAEPANVCHVLVVLDGATEDILEVFKLDSFSLPAFTEQFDVPIESDPQMHDRYAVGPDDEDFLRDHLPEGMVFDFRVNAYFVEAVEND